MEESFKINSILNNNISKIIIYLYFKILLILDDSDATELYRNDGSILLMAQLLRDDENFIDLI
jgi:hypothetical protein